MVKVLLFDSNTVTDVEALGQALILKNIAFGYLEEKSNQEDSQLDENIERMEDKVDDSENRMKDTQASIESTLAGVRKDLNVQSKDVTSSIREVEATVRASEKDVRNVMKETIKDLEFKMDKLDDDLRETLQEALDNPLSD